MNGSKALDRLPPFHDGRLLVVIELRFRLRAFDVRRGRDPLDVVIAAATSAASAQEAIDARRARAGSIRRASGFVCATAA